MASRYSKEEVLDLLKEFTGGNFEPSSDWEYVNVDLPIPGTCLLCGYSKCGPRLYDLKRGKGFCKQCARNVSPSQKEAEELIEKYTQGLFQPNKNWCYTNALTPIPGKCLACGKEDCAPRMAHLKSGRGHCKRCAGQESPSPKDALQKITEWTNGRFIPEKNWVYVNAHTPIPGTCTTCGNPNCAPPYHQLRKGFGHCKRCAGQEKLTHKEALEIIATTTHGKFEPKKGWKYKNIDSPVYGTCLTCGYEGCKPRIWTLKNGQGHCRYCSGSGFRPEDSAILYFLKHENHRLVKIGICNSESRRIKNFLNRGWEIIDAEDFEDGSKCFSEEAEIHELLSISLTNLKNRPRDLDARLAKASGNLYGQTEMYPYEMFTNLFPSDFKELKKLLMRK